MTGTSTKVRGVFLAALMVLSVFAVATPAAAGVASADRTVSSTSVAPGGTTTVTVSATMDGDGGSLTISETFSPNVAGASIQSVQVNGASTSPVVAAADSTGVVVTLSGLAANDEVTVEYEVTLPDAAGTHTISGEATSSNTVDLGSTDITVESGGGGDNGDTGEVDYPNPSDIDGELFWAGETFTVGGLDGGEQIQVREVTQYSDNNEVQSSRLVRSRTVPDDGVYEVDTDGFEGDYFLSGSDAGAAGTSAIFEVANQDLGATFDPDTFLEDEESDLEFDSKRSNWDMYVEADGLDEEELADIFADVGDDVLVDDGTDDNEADDGVITVSGVEAGETYTVNFTDISADDYTFDFEVTDTGATTSASATVQSKDVTLSFASSSYTEQVGDIAEITVNMQDTDDAYVFVGGPDVSYLEVIHLMDDSEDGEVTLEMNTWTAGQSAGTSDSSYAVADGDDDMEIVQRYSDTTVDDTEMPTQLDSPLEAGDYTLRVGSSASFDAASDTVTDEEDVAVLNLMERSTTGVTIHTAPTGAADSADDVDELLSDATQANEIALGDRMIVQVEASGIFGYLDSVSSGDALQSAGYSLMLEQTNPPANAEADEIDISDGEIYTDDANNTFFVVFDTRNLDNDSPVKDGDEYDATFEVLEDNPYIDSEDDEESASTSMSFDDAEASVSNMVEDVVQVTYSDESAISGTTNLAPGTELSVRVRRSGADVEPFLMTESPEVQADGSWNASFDFSTENMSGDFTVTVLEGSNELAKEDATFVEAQPETTTTTPTTTTPAGEASFSLSGLSVDKSSVRIAEDFLVSGTVENTGDANGTYTAELVIDGNAVTTKEVFVEAGQTTDFSIEWELVTPGEYTVILNGQQAGTVTVQERTTTTTPTPTTTTPTPTTTTTTTTPGFGIGVALVALLGAALLALRRKD